LVFAYPLDKRLFVRREIDMRFDRPIAVRDIAQQYNCELIGDDAALATGLNEIHNVTVGDLTFVDHEKYYDFTLRSAATVILINKRIDAPTGKVLLYHTDPFVVYNMLARQYHPLLPSTQAIAPSAQIGAGTTIYPTAHIGEGVTIGRDCIIYPHVTIYPYTQIGDGVIIHANTTIGADAFYYKGRGTHYDKMHTAGRVIIADRVEIGSGCTIDAGVSADTQIGTGTKLDSQVHIGHDTVIGEHCIICAQVGIAGNVQVGNWVTLYGKAALSKNITIGDRAILLGNTATAKSLAGGKTYLGSPADEMRTTAREWAIVKRLPEIWDKLRNT
jgi:UDP-3-O-[3-hydroxymyristoyl] glucosamine N-acyltransferase